MAQQGKQRSVDASRFAMVPRDDVPRSAFDVSFSHKTTFNGSVLVPIYVDEILPGDSVRLRMTAFCRFATPLVPIMDNVILESFFFFVPNRLLWSNWERFMGEQLNPSDTTVFLVPQLVIGVGETQVDPGLPHSVADWMGITLNAAPGTSISVNALPFRAYYLIWNEWFRDQDLETPWAVDPSDGPDSFASYGVGSNFGVYRGKRHDYFTTARPWPQKPMNIQDSGLLGVNEPGGRMGFSTQMPIGGAPVTGLGVLSGATPSAGSINVRMPGNRAQVSNPTFDSVNDTFYMFGGPGDSPDVRVLVNDIRMAVMVQGLLERNARGGTRYTELVRSHFGVVSPDQRLQRPEYLGGGRTHMNVNPVAQTSATGASGTVLGELAGIGTGVATNHGFSQSFTEHGVLLGLLSVRADLSYQEGVNRMWFRRTQFDFYWPGLAHLGEQAIQSREIYSDGSAGDTSVFGYQERWSEYKYKPSRISGVFRSSYGTPYDMWHLSQHFGFRPVLNDVFIQEAPPFDRVLQTNTTGTAQFLLDSLFDVRMVRAMPMFSIPGLGPRL